MISALLVLGISVVVGTIAHELSHALALRSFHIPHVVRWFPDRGESGSLSMGLRGRWAMVTYGSVPATVDPWKLRVAAMMPLTLTLPVIVVYLGLVPVGPIEGNLIVSFAAIGWLACAIPSPADFAIFWHPEESIDRATDSTAPTP